MIFFIKYYWTDWIKDVDDLGMEGYVAHIE